MARHIAIVEDETALAANYRDILQRERYRVTLHADRPGALASFDIQRPDLAIIDIGLGDEVEGGFDLCREISGRWPEVLIVFLTARESEPDKISGLRLGADDYFTKDISASVMLARIAALFRRAAALGQPEQQEHVLRCGALRLNVERMTVHWEDQAVDLTPVEFRMVHCLVRNPGHVKSRQQLMDAADIVQDESTVNSHIKRMRRKFEAACPGFDLIETVYGAGYRWSGKHA